MNEVTLWDPNSGAALPAYLTDAFGDLGSNIPDRMTVPSLSYEGKLWTIVKDGNKHKLMARNNDGDEVPIPVMRLVILDFNGERGRAYYPGTYNPAQSAAPICWSPDGKAPDASVKEKQATTCQGCPQSIKGSKVVDGREMVACAAHRMIAIAPAFALNEDPLRLKIAVTSDYDKETVEHGWFAFKQYTDYLKSRGIAHTALVVTKVKFDPNVAYPKLLFALDRVLSQDEVAQAIAATKNPKTKELLAEKWTAAGVNGTPVDDSDIRPHGLEGAYADGWQAHPDAAGYSWKGSEVLDNAALAARYPAPPPKQEQAPTPPTQQPEVPASQMVIDQAPPTPPAAPAAGTDAAPWNPIQEAEKDGWTKHPDNPDYHFKGSDVVLSAELIGRYPAPAAAEPAAPPAPPAPPPAPAAAPVDPYEAAKADGWAVHPENAAYWFKGSEVIPQEEVATRYAGSPPAAGATTAAGGATSGAPAAAADPGAAAGGATTSTTTSPSDGAVPAEVQDLLNKWTQ